MNMQIIRYSSSQEVVFRSQFLSYFLEDLKIPLTPRQVNEKICTFLLRQVEKGIVFLDLLYRDETPIGFCLYQIDKNESDWCKQEGWGFIREFYIEQSERRQSCGTYLCRAVEKRLYEMGANDLYLTADSAVPFWEANGYSKEGPADMEGIFTLSKRAGKRC